jgi:4,5-DOPA dioxygenase extradiol
MVMPTSSLMPMLFVGHGSPMNAVEHNIFSQAWSDLGKLVPLPKAILSISAHWETDFTAVTAMEQPRLIYDFYGFPQDLYRVKYNAPGAPKWAKKTISLVKSTKIQSDDGWGLDHGTWVPLLHLFPHADLPVFQLSLSYQLTPKERFQLGMELKVLREQGVFILGSGNIVHNLAIMQFEGEGFHWAIEFDQKVKSLLEQRNFDPLIEFHGLPKWELAINSAEHYLPLIYLLGACSPTDKISFYASELVYRSVSMRCVLFS